MTKPIAPHLSKLRATLRTLAAGASGFSTAEVSGYAPRMLWNTLDRMCAAGELHKAQISHKVVRYFSNKAHADKYEKTHAKSVAKSYASPRAHATWPRDAEPHFPTRRDGSPAYKVTIAPPSPQPLYTNTYARY